MTVHESLLRNPSKIRSFCGAETNISLVVDDTGSHYLSFSTSDEASACD